jgi:hypothetical protein
MRFIVLTLGIVVLFFAAAHFLRVRQSRLKSEMTMPASQQVIPPLASVVTSAENRPSSRALKKRRYRERKRKKRNADSVDFYFFIAEELGRLSSREHKIFLRRFPVPQRLSRDVCNRYLDRITHLSDGKEEARLIRRSAPSQPSSSTPRDRRQQPSKPLPGGWQRLHDLCVAAGWELDSSDALGDFAVITVLWYLAGHAGGVQCKVNNVYTRRVDVRASLASIVSTHARGASIDGAIDGLIRLGVVQSRKNGETISLNPHEKEVADENARALVVGTKKYMFERKQAHV